MGLMTDALAEHLQRDLANAGRELINAQAVDDAEFADEQDAGVLEARVKRDMSRKESGSGDLLAAIANVRGRLRQVKGKLHAAAGNMEGSDRFDLLAQIQMVRSRLRKVKANDLADASSAKERWQAGIGIVAHRQRVMNAFRSSVVETRDGRGSSIAQGARTGNRMMPDAEEPS